MGVIIATPSRDGVSDHGDLTGLLDDDHTQYLLIDGSRAMTGDLDLGGFDLTNVNLVDGRDVSVDGTVQDTHIADGTIHFADAPIDGNIYGRRNATWAVVTGGGGGAPTDAEYLVLSANATLTDERVFIAGAGLAETDGGAGGNFTVDIVAGDGSITVNPNNITVGVINATQHGTQTDSTLHALGTTAAPGFIEIATQAEVDTGTDPQLAVTPDTLNNTTLFDGRYVDFVSAETITGLKTFNVFGSGVLGQNDLVVGDITDYGLAKFGNSTVGRTAFNALSLDLDGSMLFFNEAIPATSQIEFAFADASNNIRFALAVPGPGNATYSARSMLIAGPAVLDDEIVTVGYWRTNNSIFDNIDCDTSANGADLGVQNDLEVEGIIYTDNIQESTPGAAITLTADDLGAGGGSGGDGQMTWDGNQIALFPSDITFGEGYLFGWGATGDPTTPFANRWNLNSASGFSFIFSNADFPQWIIGSTEPTSSVFWDGNGNKDIRFNTLDTGFDQDNVVYFGYGGINLQDQAGDAIFLRSAATVAGTYTITLPDTDGDAGQILVNTDGAATLDWAAGPVDPLPGAFIDSVGTNITTAAATVGLDTEQFDPDSNYALAAGEITVTEGGYYDISYTCTINDDSTGGATRGQIFAWVEVNTVAVPQSYTGVYHREASDGSGLGASFIVELDPGDVIRWRIQVSSTVDVSLQANENGLSIHRIRLQ